MASDNNNSSTNNGQPQSTSAQVQSEVKQNASETTTAVSKAGSTLKNMVSGDANIVDAVVAVKGAFDAVTGLSGKISASVMMPAMKVLASFKGQAILPAGKQMDPVMGIDVHMVTIPPSPAPVPLPHPYIGTLFDPKDWVSCLINTFKKDLLDKMPEPDADDKSNMASIASNKDALAGMAMGMANMSASVKFGVAIPRAVTGTATKNVPHIPMGAGWHPGFAAAVAKNKGKAFLGSLFVAADGDPMVGCFHLHYDCWDIGVVDLFKSQRNGAKKKPNPPETQTELFVPSGTVMAIPWGKPVLVNSVPTPINPLMILDKLFKAALGKAARHLGEALINVAKKSKLGSKLGCDHWSAVSQKIGTGQSHPVDVSGGYFYTTNEDFKIPGVIPLVWERVWQSFSNYNGPLGYGWHHSYDIALNIDFNTKVAVVRLADGRPAAFEIPVKDKPSFNRSEKLMLQINDDGYYYLTDEKGLIYRFTESKYVNRFSNTEGFLLQSISNQNGFAIRFEYDTNGLLVKITDSANRILTVNNNGQGKITSITAPHPQMDDTTFSIASYAYSAQGDLEKQMDALNQSMLFYYKNHLMVKEVWRNGCVWNLRYNKPSGKNAKCVEVWGTGDLLHYRFDYTDPNCTVVINSRGFKKLFYHKNGVVTKFVDPLGAAWEYRYNIHNEKEWEIDPLGNQRIITYDNWGNIESVTEPNGAFMHIAYGTGNLKHKPVESVDKAGGKWRWEYDSQGNLVKRTNPVNAQTKYIYDDGFLKSIVNAKGAVTQLEYDTSYNLSRVVAANGYTMEWKYDELGSCIKSSDSSGNTRRTQFNLLSLPEMIHEPDGNIRYLKFDAEGNVIQAKDKQYNIGFAYNFLNNLVLRTQAGHSLNYFYDTEGNLIKLTNEHNEEYVFELDAADRVVKETGFDNLTRKYIRNDAGKVVLVERPGSKFTKYFYNETGNITQINYHDNSFEKYEYANNGLLLSAENNHSKIEFERDILGRITKETFAENFISYQYDLLNNRTSINSSLGVNVQNDFDELGNVTKITAGNWQSDVAYNELGLEVKRLLPGNIVCNWTRDKLGRPTRQQISNNETAIHNRQYSWDVNYRLQKITDSRTGVTQFFHDEAGNLTKTVFADGETQLRNPDAVGNLFNSPDRTDRNYDKGGRLFKSKTATYRYDDEGNLIEKKENNGKLWKYQWYANGMLQAVTRPDGDIVSFTYDALGRRLSKQYKSTVTKWLWDGNKPLHEWKEHAQTGQKLSNTAISEDGIATWLFNENNFAPTAKLKGEKTYSIVTDHLGTPYQMYKDDGEKFWEAQLDSCGKVRMLKGDEGSCPFKYQGQYEDVETGLYYNRFRYYDAEEGFYISQDPIGLLGGTSLYKYVIDTNIWVDLFGLVRGGTYYQVRNSERGGEVNHIPAYKAVDGQEKSPGHSGSPAIWMTKADHRQTASWGSSNEAIEHRAIQSQLISEGNWAAAIHMDIVDIQNNHNIKNDYSESLKKMIDTAKDQDLINEKEANWLKKQCK